MERANHTPVILAAVMSLLAVAPSPAPKPAATPNPCAGLLAQLNRPTVGFSPCAVDKGTTVFELGYQNTRYAQAPSRVQIGQGFLRFGVAQRFELDVIGPNEVVQRGAGANVSGLADSGIGFKYGLLQGQHWQLGIDGLYTTPNGVRAFTAGSATLTANLDAGYELTKTLSLGTTLSFASTGGYSSAGVHGTFGTFTPSALLLQQFGHVTQAYVEYVNVSRDAPDVGASSFADTGIQRLIGNGLEIDLEYGRSLSGPAAQRFSYIGAGIGVRIGM